MEYGEIWWGQIGSSLRLLSQIASSLQDCRSAVLQVPEKLPWRRTFYEAVDARRASFSGQRRLVRLGWEAGADPGDFILSELCSARVQAEYWPGRTCGEYLASREDILLNDYFVWVTDIHSPGDLSRWGNFLKDYLSDEETNRRRAVFLLEYDGEAMDLPDLTWITCTVKPHDCRVFCLEAADALQNTDQPAYQAEMALCLGAGDPEFSAMLLQAGTAFLKDPEKTVTEITGGHCNWEGQPFPPLTPLQINRRAWNAAIALLFPVVEQFRMDFILKYESKLKWRLPITTPNGEVIQNPMDLEIGPLWYVVSNSGRDYTREEAERVKLCREVRNLLAHNKPVPYSDAVGVLSIPK